MTGLLEIRQSGSIDFHIRAGAGPVNFKCLIFYLPMTIHGKQDSTFFTEETQHHI